jgi:leucyl-tRNA synthetase
MFGFRWDQGGPWDSNGILGVQRFVERVWDLVTASETGDGQPAEEQLRDLKRKQHQAIRRVTRDIEDFSFNTMVAGLMEYTNALNRVAWPRRGVGWNSGVAGSHSNIGAADGPGLPSYGRRNVAAGRPVLQRTPATWPEWDEELAKEDVLQIAVQVNGKVRAKIEIPVDAPADDVKAQARVADGVSKIH